MPRPEDDSILDYDLSDAIMRTQEVGRSAAKKVIQVGLAEIQASKLDFNPDIDVEDLMALPYYEDPNPLGVVPKLIETRREFI